MIVASWDHRFYSRRRHLYIVIFFYLGSRDHGRWRGRPGPVLLQRLRLATLTGEFPVYQCINDAELSWPATTVRAESYMYPQ